MNNFCDYIKWRGDINFNMSPINEIDSLILCQIAYLNFDGLLPDMDFSNGITMENLAQIFKESPDFEKRKDCGVFINPLTCDLLFAAAESNRFKNVIVAGYTSKYDLQNEEQFAAVTYVVSEKNNLVCFRGTDDTLIGWKEDFNLARYDMVPSQKDALEYLDLAMKKLPGNVTVAGHSKGGNLAVFAASKTSGENKKRIKTIYNFDGPGFTEERLESIDFSEMNEKIYSFYPHTCIVGSLFYHRGSSKVVKNDALGINQHDPFTWHVLGKEFVTEPDFDEISKVFHASFNQWVKTMSLEQCNLLVETLFEIVLATEAKTSSELEENIPKNLLKIMKKISTVDSELRNALIEIISPLSSIIYTNLPSFSDISEAFHKLK